MDGKLFGNLVVYGVLLAGSFAAAQSPRKQKVKETPPLIDSIQGRALFKAYCASCHGVDAKGDGPMASSLKVKPSDLTRIALATAERFPSCALSESSPVRSTTEGTWTSEMPVWGPIFSRVDVDQDLGRVRIDNLARYLREIQVK